MARRVGRGGRRMFNEDGDRAGINRLPNLDERWHNRGMDGNRRAAPNQQPNEGRNRNHPQNNRGFGRAPQMPNADIEAAENLKRRQANDRRAYVGFKLLEEWSNKSGDEIIVELIARKTGFEDLLDSNELSGDIIILVTRILAKLCSSAFSANKSHIMTLASKPKFIESLIKYIFNIQLQDAKDRRFNRYFWQDIDSFFNHLNAICAALIETIPTRACEVLPKVLKAIIITIENLTNSEGVLISPIIKTNFETLQEKLALCKVELERKRRAELNEQLDETPPDDFRELSVFPSSEEIVSGKHAFIRRNVIDGSYDDVDHYLDVQFRLLKEDFVAPLREGVSEFMKCDIRDNRKMKFSNVRMHRHIEFISPYFSNEKSGVLVQFDFNENKKRNRQNYQFSRRFMFGSLLCFTKDNFATILFGKVIERDMKLLEKQQIVVEFQPGQDNFDFNRPYLMVECSIYFEPYYHVLNALQNIYEDTFPMKKYLIDVNPDIEPPDYVTHQTSFAINNYAVQLLQPETWPSANDLKLDDTQHAAFKSALIQSFSVIQGPPGTGKTYLGLEIARTLIHNKSYWYSPSQTPMLVVCFTNHALDQFLEGLIGTTKSILRVGGQSKNKNLEVFNIRNQRRSIHQKINTQAMYTVRIDLQHKLNSIKNWTNIIDRIEKFDSIIHFDNFATLDRSISKTWFETATEEDIIDWLLGGRTPEERKREERKLDLGKLMEDPEGVNVEDEINPNLQLEQMLEDEHREAVEDIDDIFEELLVSHTATCILSTETIIKEMQHIMIVLQHLGNDNDVKVYNKRWEMENRFLDLQYNLQYLQRRLNEGRFYMSPNNRDKRKPDGLNLFKPHHMLPDNRWRLYFYWLNLYKTALINKLVTMQAEYRELYLQYIELKDIADIQVMKNMKVVGMTTTGAARLQTSLKTLKCRVVIVEEAAEVLESHIVVSLTKNCEHLILIGDHKQLRPSTATYKLEKDFNLGISLFERMVRNKIQCHVLGVQHRMRPEFAKLIVPTIYPTLKNHDSVNNFPPVFGVMSNLYFITHNKLEEEVGDTSKQNMHEANFLIALARYLLQNGYQPEDITIVAAYSGQMFALWRLRNDNELLLKDVRITVLDNYQGEESKIILLSLVRNNMEGKIGFLKNENRVCVALSRAREGFFIIGNIDILCSNSVIWPKVKEVLVQQKALGTSLPLQCQLHPQNITYVESANDFTKVPEGGCNVVCESPLACGHTCARICHINDRVHATTICKVKCEKVLCKENHKCPQMCYQECGKCQVRMRRLLLCGHEHAIPCSVDPVKYDCPTLIACKLPCNHEVINKPCYMDPAVFQCPFDCDTRVEPCGHACRRSCHIQNDPDHIDYKCFKPCENTSIGCSTGEHKCPKNCYEVCPPCEIVIKKQGSRCTHVFEVACNFDVDKLECHKNCKRKLSCGHKCLKKCFEACGDCQEMVHKQLPFCKHNVRTKCSKEPEVKNCYGKCPKSLPCGHPCTKTCREPCTKDCNVLVNHRKPVACGHQFQIPCYMVNQDVSSNDFKLLEYCRQPCRTELMCEHSCSGTCGECVQGRIHKTCKEKCGSHLVCGHECTTPCRQTCQPCTKQCNFKCSHSACKKKCGDPCTECKEPCPRSCAHRTCKAKCGQICKVPPCTEPCPKRLKCGHNCVGFCGDPCPKLCRICNNDELCEIFFGTEDEEDARFVLLECKHVVESEGMENWLNQDDDGIGYKQCPKCKTTLCETQRYSNYIKRAREDVINIKKRYFGNSETNDKERTELLQHIAALSKDSRNIRKDLDFITFVIEGLKTAILPTRGNRKQPINKLLIDTFKAKIQILQRIVTIFNEAELKKHNTNQNMLHLIGLLLGHLLPPMQRITNQEIADFDRELNRLVRLAQLSQLEEQLQAINNSEISKLHNEIKTIIMGIHVFTEHYNLTAKEKILKLHKDIKSSARITEHERQQVVRAMGMGLGHWYKCPNGHYYAIGECGGAMQVGKCIECGVAVGGSSHRLLTSNRHASEMDHSTRAAWPPH